MHLYVLASIIPLLLLLPGYAAAGVVEDAPEASDYSLVYELLIPDAAAFNSTGVDYNQDLSSSINFTFDRVAYHLELQRADGDRQFVYVSMPAQALTAQQIGIPHSGGGMALQEMVQNLHVVSNHPDLAQLSTVNTGSIEFWPSNYGTTNTVSVPNASDDLYDAGDQSLGGAGYGSMQVHDYATGTTLFAYNAWGSAGGSSDIGIGNNPAISGSTGHPDWTFAQNASTYTLKTLRILVRPGPAPRGLSLTVQSPEPHQVVQRQTNGQGSLSIGGQLRMACDRIEGRLVPIGLSGEDSGTATNWTVVDESPSGSSFSGSLNADAGWYRLELKVSRDETILDTVQVSPVGIGEVFITAGQSNSANHGEFPTSPIDPRVSAWGEGGWQVAADPQPIATGDGGSPWPALGDLLAQRWNVPIGFISVGWGGTSVDQWRPYSNVGLYSRLQLALDAVGHLGAQAILWHQGESDAAVGTSAGDYTQQLQEVIAASRHHAGWDIPWGLAQAAFLPGLDASALQAILDGQRAVIEADPLTFAGASTEDLLGSQWRYDDVHFNVDGLREHASRWNAAIELPTPPESEGDNTLEPTPANSDESQETNNNDGDSDCPTETGESGGCQAYESTSTTLSFSLLLLIIWSLRRRHPVPE